VSSSRDFDIAVLGGGPAGLVSALAAAKHVRTALVVDRLSIADDPMRIDSIPARTLALLVELGVDPRALGTKCLHSGRWAGWEAAAPAWHQGAQTAHIERPRLEQALFEAVRATGRVTIIMDGTRPRWAKGFIGTGWRAQTLIDATGRASVTARVRKRPAHPWASRFFWTARREISPEFRIAALSCGYAYRLGSADRIGIGIAGRGRWLNADPPTLERLLRNEAAEWLLEGMPPVSSMVRGASGTSSVQWARGGRSALVGDAALSRDSLSSQGLAASISDALYAIAAAASGDVKSLRERHTTNLASHLTYLTELVRRCRFRASPLWHAYETFVAGSAWHQTAASYPALRDGRLVAAEDLHLDKSDIRSTSM
jgi:2-polyprenyl-6-methoxyphenol hydroxylase-like FAD-dependent oxidoreductase